MKKKSKKSEVWLFADKVYKGKVALVVDDGTMIMGEVRFTVKKTKKKGGQAIFEITLIKDL